MKLSVFALQLWRLGCNMRPGLALICLCLGTCSIPGLALTAVESGSPATRAPPAPPAPPVTRLRPDRTLKETFCYNVLQRSRLLEVWGSSESSAASRVLDCGGSMGRLVFRLVQFAFIFFFNVAGHFVLMAWMLSPNSTIFGLFEQTTQDEGNKIPAPLSKDAKSKLALCLVASIVIPTATTAWALFQHTPNATEPTGVENISVPTTTEAPMLHDASASSVSQLFNTYQPNTISSLILSGISNVLGGLGFFLVSFLLASVTLGRLINEQAMRGLMGRIFESFSLRLRAANIPPTVLVILVPVLVLFVLSALSLCFLVPTYVFLKLSHVTLQAFGLGWVMRAALNAMGALALGIPCILAFQDQ